LHTFFASPLPCSLCEESQKRLSEEEREQRWTDSKVHRTPQRIRMKKRFQKRRSGEQNMQKFIILNFKK
jgi:hypothetical protein